MSGLSNILNASADTTDDHYNRLSEEKGGIDFPKRVRRRAGDRNNVGRGFYRVMTWFCQSVYPVRYLSILDHDEFRP